MWITSLTQEKKRHKDTKKTRNTDTEERIVLESVSFSFVTQNRTTN